MARKKVRLKRFMVDGHDPETGEMFVPVIYLWKTKDGINKKDNVGGALWSGTEIEIIRRDREDWIRIAAVIEHKGKKYPQRGYVKKSLIKEMVNNG